jgi:hypothetical protein
VWQGSSRSGPDNLPTIPPRCEAPSERSSPETTQTGDVA